MWLAPALAAAKEQCEIFALSEAERHLIEMKLTSRHFKQTDLGSGSVHEVIMFEHFMESSLRILLLHHQKELEQLAIAFDIYDEDDGK